MDDVQAEDILERIEIPIRVEQCVAMTQAEGGDQTIDRLSDRVAVLAQQPIVLRGRDGELYATGLEHFEAPELAEYTIRVLVAREPLKDFAHHQVEEAEPLTRRLPIEPVGLRRRNSVQVIDPDGRIDDDHRSALVDGRQSSVLTRAVRLALRSPVHLTLPRRRRMLA